MRDFNQTFEAQNNSASGQITIDDFESIALGTVTVGSDDLTEGTDFDAEVDNDTTATNLAAAITALAGVSASAEANVVTVVYDTPGTGGNSVALASSKEGHGITLSGDTLEGGVAEAYSDVFSYDTDENIQEVEEILTIISKTGTLTIDVTPQYSLDKVNWSNATAFAQKTAAGTETLNRTTTGLFTRYKYVIGGTAPLVNFMIQAVAK